LTPATTVGTGVEGGTWTASTTVGTVTTGVFVGGDE